MAKQISIINRLTFFLVSIFGTFAIVASGSIATLRILESNKEMVKTATQLADNYALILDRPVWNIDISTINSIGKTISYNKNISRILLTAPDKKEYFSFTSDPQLTDYSVFRIIDHESKITAYLTISFSTKSLDKATLETIIQSVVLTLLLLVIIYFSIRIIVMQTIKRSLKDLHKTVKILSQKDYEFTGKTIPIVEFHPFEQILNQLGQNNYKQLQELRNLYEIINKKNEEISELNTDLEKRILKRTLELQNSNRELESFSYSVSHDLRAPLRHISGYVQLLEKKHSHNLNEEALHYLETIKGSATQMGQLIDDLLKLSRTVRTDFSWAEIDMNKIVSESISMLSAEIEVQKVKWEVSQMPPAIGDPVLIKQVWMNLISNGLKYSRNRDEIHIEIGSLILDQACVYFVRDNGVGFDPEYSDKLFGVFQRLHSDHDFEGNGIGLAIVQKIIAKHEGRVWAEGKVDQGATFYFCLRAQGGAYE